MTDPRVWCFVRDFERGAMHIAISEGEPIAAGVAMVDVDDVRGHDGNRIQLAESGS